MSIHVVYAFIDPMLKLITCVIFFAVNEMKPYILSQFENFFYELSERKEN